MTRRAFVIIVIFMLNLQLVAMEGALETKKLGVTTFDVRNFLPEKSSCIFANKNSWAYIDSSYRLLSDDEVKEVAEQLNGSALKREFLQKLNFGQVLALLDYDLKHLKERKDDFDSSVVILGTKLRQLLHMSPEELAKNLIRTDVKAWFNQEPLLFKGLVKLLDDSKLNDPVLVKRLFDCLNSIRETNNPVSFIDFRPPDSELRHSIEEIRGDEALVCDQAPMAGIDKIEGSLQINVSFQDKTISLAKDRLRSISKYYMRISEQQGTSSMTLPEDDFTFLADSLKGILPKANSKNISSLLHKSHRFECIKNVCDNFFSEQKNVNIMVQIFRDLALKNCSAYWIFCCSHELKKSKKKLCEYFAQCLNHLDKDDEDVLLTIKMLDGFHLREMKLFFKGATLYFKLKDRPDLVNWLWAKSNHRNLTFLQDIVEHFCADEANFFTANSAWLIPPAGINSKE